MFENEVNAAAVAGALARGAAELGIDLPVDTRERFVAYVSLLQKWNKVYNLTAVREPREIVSHHLLDSLAVLPHVAARTILDVGSGAGLPGIPLALALPQAQVTLLDASHKRAAFLRQAVIELKIDNAAVVCERVEAWRPRERFDVVISRAFADVCKFVTRAGRLCAKEGIMAAMKAGYPKAELARLPSGFKVTDVIPLSVPGLRAARHLVLLRPA